MSQEWIVSLADGLKDKGREAAEAYALEQHRAGIIATEGKVFFTALLQYLEQNIIEVRSQLQGSGVSCETSLVRQTPSHASITRSRFPWFDATLKHVESNIVLEMAKGRGVAGGQTLTDSADRQVIAFSFIVDAHDTLAVTRSFEESSVRFERPEEMAQFITMQLFEV